MWRWALLFLAFESSAEAGQVRSSFQVGLTITGSVNASPVPAQRQGSATVPLPRPRPPESSLLTRSDARSAP
jgi:hypothetical protein